MQVYFCFRGRPLIGNLSNWQGRLVVLVGGISVLKALIHSAYLGMVREKLIS